MLVPKVNSKSRTSEVDNVAVSILDTFDQFTWENETYNVGLFTKLRGKEVKLLAAINRNKAESILQEKDSARNEAYRALGYLIQAFARQEDLILQKASNKLLVIFDNYGLKVTGENYATKSTLINSLLGDLKAPDLQSAIVRITNCAESIERLQASQDQFQAAFVEWEKVKSKEGANLNASDLKKEVLQIINQEIVEYLRPMAKAKEDVYAEFVAAVAQIIKDNNEKVKKRGKKEEEEEIVSEFQTTED